jgi:hypothetical protein
MWDIFFSEVLTKMSDAKWGSSNEWASYFAKKYDECMKRGFDITTKNPVKNGNVELMTALLQSAANIALNAKEDSFYNTYYGLIGNAVIGYWTGAELQTISIPLTPANGTLANLYVTSNIITDPASKEFHSSFAPPIKNVEQFLSTFINLARAHLAFVGGVCYTFSQYPSPLPPGPGVLNWKGYKVELGNLEYGRGGVMFELHNEDFKLTEEDIAAVEKDLNRSKIDLSELAKVLDKSRLKDKVQEQISAVEEFLNLQNHKLKTGMKINLDADLVLLNALNYNKDDDDLGARIVAYAKEAVLIPVIEKPPKSNRGPWIDLYLKSIGYQVGLYWCAAATSWWYKKAGALIPTNVGGSGPAACVRWRNWAKSQGTWSKTPVLGAAVIYVDETGLPHHIGIVANPRPDKNGRILTIEGNTSGGTGFNRNGGGTYLKNPRLAEIDGYIIPTEDPSWLWR